MAAVRQELSYHHELRAGAVISVYSRVLEAREKVILFSHDMHNDETHELAATTTITGVYLNTPYARPARSLMTCGHSPCNSVSRMAATNTPRQTIMSVAPERRRHAPEPPSGASHWGCGVL